MNTENNIVENSEEEFDELIDNSKMFSRWYKFSGRIGRLEFGLMILIGILIFAISLAWVVRRAGGTLEYEPIESTFLGYALISALPLFLIGAASWKRANDVGKSPKKYLGSPVILSIILLFKGCSLFALFFCTCYQLGYSHILQKC